MSCTLLCKHSMKSLNKEHSRVYNDETFATVSQQTDSHLSHTECRWDLSFPLLLPILGSGNSYTCGQTITGYSSCTCITQDLGSRSHLLKRHRVVLLLSLQVQTHRVHSEQTGLCLSECSMTYSCSTIYIFFLNIGQNHIHLSFFVFWFNYLKWQGLNELLKNEI